MDYKYNCEDCGKELEFVSEKRENEYIQCNSCSDKEIKRLRQSIVIMPLNEDEKQE